MRQTIITWLLVSGTCVLVASLACDGGSGTDIHTTSGPTQFSGAWARYWTGPVSVLGSSAGSAATSVRLDVFETPIGCPTPTADAGVTSRTRGLYVEVLAFEPRALTPGSYPAVSSDPTLQVSAYYFDVNHSVMSGDGATDGKIFFDRLAPEAQGYVDLTLTDGTHLAGPFRATACRPVCFTVNPDGGAPINVWCNP